LVAVSTWLLMAEKARGQLRGQESIMANDAFTKPEVPDAFRDLMKISIEQTKRAFETFASTSEKAWKTFETSSQTASSGLRSLNEKIAEITRNNAEANFALAMRLAESKDVSQAMELQTEHARKQMESFVHQLEEIRDLAAQVIQDSTPPGMPGAKP
jgi:phasin